MPGAIQTFFTRTFLIRLICAERTFLAASPSPFLQEENMRIRTIAVAAVAAGTAALSIAAPASAMTRTVELADIGATFGGTSITTPDSTGGTKAIQSLTQTATGQNVGGTLSTTTIAVECAAVAAPAVGTGVTSCYLKGANGSVYHVPRTGAKPGEADAAASAVLTVPLQDYSACVSSQALMQDNTYLTAPTQCFG
jgi:O-acetyl-ADP-ribose deacetylase (regulator of RNase III)